MTWRLQTDSPFSSPAGDNTEVSQHGAGLSGEVCLKVDVRKNKDAARLHEMLCSWQQAAAMLEAGEISKEDYDKWRYPTRSLIKPRIM